jgi:hypothetical protein
MLIVRITGGIGNQLFQYAFIRSLSLKLKKKFFLDLSWYRNYSKFEDINNPNSATKREYLLNHFNISENILSPIYLSISHRLSNYLTINNLFFNYFQYSVINETEFDINQLPDKNLYFRGFWQNSKLFTEYSDIIKKEFSLKDKLSKENQIYLDKINSVNGIAVHIRRGDLLSRPVAVEDQPYSTEEYYQEGISIIKRKVSNLDLFVFSDDINWVEANLTFNLPTTYINSKGPDYEHFYLMSNCNHHIIANSTFSWWAAWLNNYKNKIVISPKWWYRNPIKNNKIIWIPDDWIILNNI